MAASKKRDQYTVVLEDLRSQFKVFGEALGAYDDRFDRIDGELRELRSELRAGFARIEVALDKKVDRDEVHAMIARGLAGR